MWLQRHFIGRFVSSQLRDVLTWYSEDFKDPMVVDPPEWFKSFIFCEALLQLPFFPIAAYAFFKGQLAQKAACVKPVAVCEDPSFLTVCFMLRRSLTQKRAR